MPTGRRVISPRKEAQGRDAKLPDLESLTGGGLCCHGKDSFWYNSANLIKRRDS